MAITTTPRLGLTQWTAGSDPFTRAQMNAAMKAIDDHVAQDAQGLAKDRPAKAPAGTYYYATDTLRVSRSDGASWRELGSAIDLQGRAADRPTSAMPGTYFFDTDARQLFRWDGTSWAAIGSAVDSMSLLLMGV